MSREPIRTKILRQINQTEERPAKGVHLALNPNSNTVMGWTAGPQDLIMMMGYSKSKLTIILTRRFLPESPLFVS